MLPAGSFSSDLFADVVVPLTCSDSSLAIPPTRAQSVPPDVHPEPSLLAAVAPSTTQVRRSSRQHRPPTYLQDYQ